MKNKLKYIIISIVLLFVITFGYNYINKKQPVGVEEEVFATNIDQEAQEIIKTLDAIGKIKIDNGFFSDNFIEEDGNLISFFNLIDFSQEELPEKPFGKENPFLEGSSLNNNPFSEKKQIENQEGISSEKNTDNQQKKEVLTEDEKKLINQ